MEESLHADAVAAVPQRGIGRWLEHRLQEVNRELWLVLSMFVLAAVLNFAAGSERMIIGFYTLPTLFSAYVFGRRHAVLTAFASVFLVGMLCYFNPQLLTHSQLRLPVDDKWFDLTVWAGILVLTAYAMGTLHERHVRGLQDLRETYRGVLVILQSVISKDKDAENHSYRVSVYASKIAQALKLEPDRVEDVRSAALLHELANVDIGRDILQKAARFAGDAQLETQAGGRVGGSLPRVLPILLGIAADDKLRPYTNAPDLPIESRILSVADVFDSLTSDRPYRKAMSPFDAKEVIVRGAGVDFDRAAVNAFVFAFDRRQLEPPALAPAAALRT